MKNLLALLVLLTGCASDAPPPVDKNGKTPDAVVVDAYRQMFAGNFESARSHFDDRLINAIFPPTNPENFESFFKKQIVPWKMEQLKTVVEGTPYNDNVWRVNINIDAGKGKNNPGGAVHDLALIDGAWKFVFWGDYPKS